VPHHDCPHHESNIPAGLPRGWQSDCPRLLGISLYRPLFQENEVSAYDRVVVNFQPVLNSVTLHDDVGKPDAHAIDVRPSARKNPTNPKATNTMPNAGFSKSAQ
jgi:hypothetical protein